MKGGVPANLSEGASVLNNAGTNGRDGALAVTNAGSQVSGACGDSPVGAAADRVAAAYSGQLVSWALATTQLGQVAAQSGEEITAATGG